MFVGYPLHQHGYKCFHLPSRKYFITIFVAFCEDQLFFHVSHIPGKSVSEESNCTLEFIEPTPNIVSDSNPHSIVLLTEKTFYKMNVIKKIESPSQLAPVQDSKPP